MKYCADTWFFIQIAIKHPKALDIWKEITEGKGRLVVSTIVVAETVKQLLMKNKEKELEAFLEAFRSSEKIIVIDVNREIAEKAGRYSFSYKIPTTDGVILATAILTEHTNILSEDVHYRVAEKQKKIKRVFW